MCKSNKIHLLLKILLCVSYFGWNAIPALLMYVPKMLGYDYFATPSYILCSYYNQIYLFAAYLLSFYLIKNKRPPKILKKTDIQDDNKAFNILLYVSIFLALYKLNDTINDTSSYWEHNDLANAKAIGPLAFITSYAFSFLVGVVFLYKSRVKHSIYILCVIIIASEYLIHTFRGGRIYIFGIVIFYFYYAIKKSNLKNLIISVVACVFALGLLPVLSNIRGGTQIGLNDAIEAGSTSIVGSQILGEVLNKTNSVMSGSYLIEKDGIGKWNGQMYTSTIFALIPRFIYPSKPEPGSVDGTAEGLPARATVIYRVVGEYNGIGNAGVTASLSSLWGGGWIAYLVEIIFTAFLIFFINGVFWSNKPLFACFVFALLSFPVCVLEVPLPTIMMSLQRDIVIYLLILFLLSPYVHKKRRIHQFRKCI